MVTVGELEDIHREIAPENLLELISNTFDHDLIVKFALNISKEIYWTFL